MRGPVVYRAGVAGLFGSEQGHAQRLLLDRVATHRKDVLLAKAIPARDAVEVVGPGEHILLGHFLDPPAQLGHPVLARAGGERFRLPALDQRLHVLGLQARRLHVMEAHLLQLVGDHGQNALARVLRGKAAVAVAQAELLQFVVQVSHRVLFVRYSIAPGACRMSG